MEYDEEKICFYYEKLQQLDSKMIDMRVNWYEIMNFQ